MEGILCGPRQESKGGGQLDLLWAGGGSGRFDPGGMMRDTSLIHGGKELDK